MTHRAEQIVAAAVSILAASTELGISAVLQDRQFSLQEDIGELPCVCVTDGDDDPVSDEGNDSFRFIDTQLDLEIVGYAVGRDEPTVKAELRRQRRFIHKALLAYFDLAQNPLGLEFVIAVKYGGADKANLSVSGEATAGSMLSRWRVHYRQNLFDPGD